MQLGIALLLWDASPDLAATVHAIELAKRTGGIVHAIFAGAGDQRRNSSKTKEAQQNSRSTSIAQIISLATWWSEKQGVKVHLHMLDSLSDAALLRLCGAYRIYCLVTGVSSRHSLKREVMRVARLRRRLAAPGNSDNPILWSVIIRAWHDFAFEPIVSRFEKVVWQKDHDCPPTGLLQI
jgi:hypothetical protein